MTTKTLAILVDTDDNRYRLNKWSKAGSRRANGNPKRPAKLSERSSGDGWEFLESWPSDEETETYYATLKDDREVLEEAIKRLKMSFGADVSEIIYDDYNDEVLDHIAGKSLSQQQ